MAKAKQKKTQVKKKKWVDIVANKPYNNNKLGETYVVDAKDKLGTKMSISMSQVTGDKDRYNLKLKFQLTSIKEGKLRADLIGAFLLHTSTRKMVRKNRNKLDMSFSAKTKDDKNLRVKMLVVTRYKTTSVILTKLTKQVIWKVRKDIETMNYQDFLKMLLERRFQKTLGKYLSKTYPVWQCEMRYFELVDKVENEETVVMTEETGEELSEPVGAEEVADSAEAAE
jgi:small subunit ribosomal protein S3Ae